MLISIYNKILITNRVAPPSESSSLGVVPCHRLFCGQNRRCHPNLLLIAEYLQKIFYSKNMQADQKLLDELVRRIVSAVHPLRIILFGSAVRGEMCPNSDFDVLVVMPDGVQRRKTAQYIYSQMLDFGFAKDIAVATKSDLKNYKNNPGLIYKQALSEGKELYHAPIVNQYPVRDKPTFFQSLLCPGNA